MGILFKTSHLEGRTAYVSSSSISLFVAIFSTILAAALLFGAIISLYMTTNERAVLGMLCGWTVLFAGVTAAYAAVLVVFVSGNLGGVTSSGAAQVG
jgi:hypothetical protein